MNIFTLQKIGMLFLSLHSVTGSCHVKGKSKVVPLLN